MLRSSGYVTLWLIENLLSSHISVYHSIHSIYYIIWKKQINDVSHVLLYHKFFRVNHSAFGKLLCMLL